MKNNQDSFEKVIPTAWMVAYRRTFSDIPYSKEIFDKLEEIRKRNNYEDIPSELKKPELSPQFEARHKLIDKLIYQNNSAQILELASGFSSRGLIMSLKDNFNYVEFDLDLVISSKIQIVTEILSQNDLKIPQNLHFFAGNALNFEDMKNSLRCFDRSKPLVITNE